MGEFAILNSRKRAFIALVHSLVFLALATWQMMGGATARGLLTATHASGGTWTLCGIYVVVTSVLFWLFAVSRGWMEKLYFLLCTVSAASGLLRTIIGDHGFHSGRYLRVVMLTSAVIVGTMIIRLHSEIVARSS